LVTPEYSPVRGADTALEEPPWAKANPAKPEIAMHVIAAVLSFVIVTILL
jgi:hypothetical protein